MFFLIKMIFRLATIGVFALIIYVVYAKLTGKNVEFGELDLKPAQYEELYVEIV